MKKEKWLLKEIDLWRQLELVDAETAEKLRSRYTQAKNNNILIILFSVIGALLIGAGIILIGAKNWDYFPIPLRAVIAFLPLLVSQALAVFVIKAKYNSIAWRESIAILITASVFTVIAMVGQVFHLPGDYSAYVLGCALLSLPVIFILDAASPLLVYYWAVLNWAALESSPEYAPVLFGLFALGALFVFLKRKQVNVRLMYMIWITVIAAFIMIWIMGNLLDCSLLLALLCYFVLLLSIDDFSGYLSAPFKIIGTVGGITITAILTYKGMWLYGHSPANAGNSVMISLMLAAAVFFAVSAFKRDKRKFILITALILLCAVRFAWTAFNPDDIPYDHYLTGSLFAGAANLILLLIGVEYIVYGIRNTSLLQTNIGMAAICTLIVMRFFDSDLDFLWRGIIFLVLGIVFLLVNVKIIHAKKQPKQGPDL